MLPGSSLFTANHRFSIMWWRQHLDSALLETSMLWWHLVNGASITIRCALGFRAGHCVSTCWILHCSLHSSKANRVWCLWPWEMHFIAQGHLNIIHHQTQLSATEAWSQFWNQVTGTVSLLFSLPYWRIRARWLFSLIYYYHHRQAVLLRCAFVLWNRSLSFFCHDEKVWSKRRAWSLVHSLIIHRIPDSPPSELQVYGSQLRVPLRMAR